MAALGEMASWLPLGSGFTGYATRFSDPALGFALGWNYYFKYIMVTPNQLTAASLVIQYWVKPSRINPGVFIAIFLVAIVAINYFGIKFFGEFEFVSANLPSLFPLYHANTCAKYLSSIKVVVIIALILLCLILVCGGGPKHEVYGFKYWSNPGAFKPYLKTGATGRFLATWSAMTTAVFAYLGTELVGVTVGEAANPRKVIPRAIKLTFYRILLFYVVLIFFLGMLVPYNSPELAEGIKFGGNTAAASPFVIAIKIAGIKHLPGILNGAILIFVFSAANSDLYIASRTLYGLAKEGKAPAIFKKTDSRGVPIYALGLSVMFCFLAFLGVNTSSYKVFGYFTAMVTIFGLLTWIAILITHITFVRARKAQGITNDQVAYVAPLGMWGSVGALFFCCLIAIFRGFPTLAWKAGTAKGKPHAPFDHATFITTYLGIPVFICLFVGYKIFTKSKWLSPLEADLFSGKDKIDREEAEYIAAEQAKRNGKDETVLEKWYRRTLGHLF